MRFIYPIGYTKREIVRNTDLSYMFNDCLANNLSRGSKTKNRKISCFAFRIGKRTNTRDCLVYPPRVLRLSSPATGCTAKQSQRFALSFVFDTSFTCDLCVKQQKNNPADCGIVWYTRRESNSKPVASEATILSS